MERRRWLTSLVGIGAVLILIVVALAVSSPSRGTPPPLPPEQDAPALLVPGPLPRAPLGRMAVQLGLSAGQSESIRVLVEQARPGFAQLRRQMSAGAELLSRTPPDDPAFESVVANVRQATADLASQFVLQASQLRSRIHAVLTPEQRDRLAVLEAALDARAEQSRERGSPGVAADGGELGAAQ